MNAATGRPLSREEKGRRLLAIAARRSEIGAELHVAFIPEQHPRFRELVAEDAALEAEYRRVDDEVTK